MRQYYGPPLCYCGKWLTTPRHVRIPQAIVQCKCTCLAQSLRTPSCFRKPWVIAHYIWPQKEALASGHSRGGCRPGSAINLQQRQSPVVVVVTGIAGLQPQLSDGWSCAAPCAPTCCADFEYVLLEAPQATHWWKQEDALLCPVMSGVGAQGSWRRTCGEPRGPRENDGPLKREPNETNDSLRVQCPPLPPRLPSPNVTWLPQNSAKKTA